MSSWIIPLLRDDIEVLSVQFLGRECRIKDPLVDDVATVIVEILSALEEYDRKPLVLFGHSGRKKH